jgi:hypothetical protein
LSAKNRASTQRHAQECRPKSETEPGPPPPAGLPDEIENHGENHDIRRAFHGTQQDRRTESNREPHRREERRVGNRGDRDRQNRSTASHRDPKKRQRAQSTNQIDRDKRMRQAWIDVVPNNQKFLKNRNDHGIRKGRENQKQSDDQNVTWLAIPDARPFDFVL